ncbi:hypothetical protein LAJ19_20815 (plasmid) [Deinococcus taeanensis]|uniref:hypothetical protein n=1 Tax=Deinococcus taeanensis TaxID=2737050 RepID=UPI001CDC2D5D|nr:hypothetical protein [Deinococcus taeanensis]UBV45243.1 hypothetical protein LAJ19_20815 [Deinococcus taeanensis]
MNLNTFIFIAVALAVVLVAIPVLVGGFLRNVQAGTIRMVSWLRGATVIYRGPGKSLEVPLLTIGTTLSSKAINVDLDITDQTADIDALGVPRPIKVRVLASAIVSVGDSDQLIKTAANRFFSKPEDDQMAILNDLLSSAGRRAINLLTHDQLFSAKTAPTQLPSARGPRAAEDRAAEQRAAEQRADPTLPAIQAAEEDDDPLAIIIRKACSKELTDLGLIFNSLNIKVVQSEVADARRRQSAAEASANADIVATQQARRAREAQLDAERLISDKSRELAQTQASNAALIAQAEALKQDALGTQRSSELRATQLAQADALRVRIEATAAADAEAIRVVKLAEANAQSIRQVNEAIMAGGEAYLRYRQIEMLPLLVPEVARALAQAKLVTVSGGDPGGAAGQATGQITDVVKMLLTLQAVQGNTGPAIPAPEGLSREQ